MLLAVKKRAAFCASKRDNSSADTRGVSKLVNGPDSGSGEGGEKFIELATDKDSLVSELSFVIEEIRCTNVAEVS